MNDDCKGDRPFCGAGGLTHGLQLAGLDVVAGIDLEGNVGFL